MADIQALGFKKRQQTFQVDLFRAALDAKGTGNVTQGRLAAGIGQPGGKIGF